MTDLARFTDVTLDRDEMVAAAFLVRYKERTRIGYQMCLKQWFAWCAAHGITPLTATRPYLEVWARELDEQHHLKPATINGKLNAVAGFYKFAKIDGYIVDNPAEHVRRPKVPRESSTNGLTRAELLHCLDTAQKIDLQDYALWCFLGLNGPRIGEALAIDVERITWTGGYRVVYLPREKGNPSGEVPLSPRTSHAFDLHLGTRKTGPVFLKPRTGERMDQKSANRVVKRIAREAGIDKRLSNHSLRHTFTTLALNAGVHVRDIANSRGDADLRQVSYYDREKNSLSRHATHMVSAYVEGA